MCIQGVCQPTCKTNSSCPDFQYCQNNICIQEYKCISDDECQYNEKCTKNSLGQAECVDLCRSAACGRNAECTAENHQFKCACAPGYRGDPFDEKQGCRKVECEHSHECTNDKLCDQNMCKIACLVRNPCGKNALCSAEQHTQVCYCQPGFTGDPYNGCTLIDFCADTPCGPGAKCENSRGSFKCLCPSGSIGDPYNAGCRAPVECHTNNDCPASTECDTSNGVPKCRDVCQNTACGLNSECVVVDHVGHCTCRDGYEGNPNDVTIGCRPRPIACRSTTDCPSNTYCYGDVCRRKYNFNSDLQF